MEDIGHAIHYAAVKPGTPVYSADGVEIGRVEAMLDNYSEHIFDGVVFADRDGKLRFADAPEVERTAERGVVLRIEADQAQRLGPPEEGAPMFKPNRGGMLIRIFVLCWIVQ